MKHILLVLLFTVALAAGLVCKLPLSFVMKQSGAAMQGLSWQQARGTVWHGQVTGLNFEDTQLGAAQLRTSVQDVLTKGIVSRANWQGPAGTASTHLKASTDRLVLQNLSATIALSELASLHPELRRTGASLILTDAAIKLTPDGRCIEVRGDAQLDLVQRLGQSYNRAWPLLRGKPVCKNGGFSLPLSGKSTAGESFEITLVWSRGGQPEADVKIAGLDAQATLALQSLGFIKTGNQLMLRQGAVLAQEN